MGLGFCPKNFKKRKIFKKKVLKKIKKQKFILGSDLGSIPSFGLFHFWIFEINVLGTCSLYFSFLKTTKKNFACVQLLLLLFFDYYQLLGNWFAPQSSDACQCQESIIKIFFLKSITNCREKTENVLLACCSLIALTTTNPRAKSN